MVAVRILCYNNLEVEWGNTMKRIVFFDLDNTLYHTKKEMILPETKKLIKALSKDGNFKLGLATGRGPKHLDIIDDFKQYFDFFVFLNGGLAIKQDKIIYENPMPIETVERVIEKAKNQRVAVGLVTKDGEYITFYDMEVKQLMRGYDKHAPVINEHIYLEKKVYQIWVFSDDRTLLKSFEDVSKDLVFYYWHHGGVDMVLKGSNKAIAIEKLLDDEVYDELITVGDGYNDIQMIEMADIGIAMGNSGFDELKEKADYIAPNIDDDQLYEFFKSLSIISW